VLTSPLRRALLTSLIFCDTDDKPLKPIIALPSLREAKHNTCDVGTPLSELKSQFVYVDFSEVKQEVWWYDQPSKEPSRMVNERIRDFLAALQTRKETHIAVVGHSTFFQKLTGHARKLNNCQLFRTTTEQLQPMNSNVKCRSCSRFSYKNEDNDNDDDQKVPQKNNSIDDLVDKRYEKKSSMMTISREHNTLKHQQHQQHQ